MKLYKPQDLWNIALFVMEDDESPFDSVFRAPEKRFTPQNLLRTRYSQVTGYADPFLFVHDGWLYLFYEEERLEAPAPICAKRTKDLKHWENIGAVLREKHHLSYPNVFEYGGNIFMLPETRECDAVILYKAIDFPFRWERCKTLLVNDKYVDSCLLNHNGLWYLFTTTWYDETGYLKIYTSDDIMGNYSEHPMSPAVKGYASSRCGGAVFEYNGQLYRPAQYCSNYYGENLGLYEITELTPTRYSEKFIKNLIDKQQIWNPMGGHHFNMTVFQGKRVVVMDGIVNDNWINNHTRKFFNAYRSRHHITE